MKKFKVILGLIISFVLGALAAAAVYFLTMSDVAWQEYLETKLLPNAVLALSSVGAICVAALPVLKVVSNAAAGFAQATSDVNASVKNKTEYDARLDAFGEDISAMKQTLAESADKLERHLAVVEKIERIGFGNTKELVVNGYAAAIAKVGREDDKHMETKT